MAFRTNKMPVLQEKSASGAVATFNTALAMPLSSCNIGVNAWQEGSGDPYPSNVRPIHGFSEVNLTANNVIYPIQLGQEVYGAEVDVVNGVAHVDKGLLIFDGTEDWAEYGSAGFQSALYNSLKLGNRQEGMANWLITTGTVNQFGLVIGLNNKRFYATHIKENISEVIDVTSWKQYLKEYPLQVVYPLANPFDIQLTPTQIETLIGNNTIFADTGDVDLTYKDLDIAKRGNFREVFKLPS